MHAYTDVQLSTTVATRIFLCRVPNEMLASWVRPLEHPPARWGHSAILYNHCMLVFGGSEGNELNNDVILFDLQPPAAHCKGVFSSTNFFLLHSSYLTIGGSKSRDSHPHPICCIQTACNNDFANVSRRARRALHFSYGERRRTVESANSMVW